MIFTNFNRFKKKDKDKSRIGLFCFFFYLKDWWFGECYSTSYWTNQVGWFNKWNDSLFLFRIRQFLYVDFKDWLVQATDIQLTDKVDLTSSKYDYTGRFLCVFPQTKKNHHILFFVKIICYVMTMIFMELLKVVESLLFTILCLRTGRKQMVELWIYSILIVENNYHHHLRKNLLFQFSRWKSTMANCKIIISKTKSFGIFRSNR